MRIRKGRVGDLGWAFQRQAIVYTKEFGYSQEFEKYLARGLAPFLDNLDRSRDRLWIAQRDDAAIGCIAIQHDADRPGWGKLRWFFVEKEARGLGVGRRLMTVALAFARRAGYDGIQLWTVDDLDAARRVYEAAGFHLAETTAGCVWAPWGKEQRWELRLGTDGTAMALVRHVKARSAAPKP